MTQNKDKGGRRQGPTKKTIGFKVNKSVAEVVKEEVRPIVREIEKKYLNENNIK